MLKNLLLGFGLCGLAIASAKTYTVSLGEPYTLAGKQLKPGDYRLSVNGNQVILRDSRGETVAASAKLQNEAKKYPYTAIESETTNGVSQLQAIELEGTRTKIQFN